MFEANYVDVFKALANEHRLRLYTILTGCCTPGHKCTIEQAQKFCVSELNAEIDIAASTLSHHLKVLHQAGLVDMKRQSKQIYYSINPKMMDKIKNFFTA